MAAAPGSDVSAEEPAPQSSSFIPSWLRSKLPAAIGGSKEYEEELEQLTMDSASRAEGLGLRDGTLNQDLI